MSSQGSLQMQSTLMVKNLPSRWSSEDILDVLHHLGFEGKYDFFYMPKRDRSGKSQSLGYAFINFIDPAEAQNLTTVAANGLLKFKNRFATVAPAQVQGLEELRRHFAGKSIMKCEAAPTFAGSRSASPNDVPNAVPREMPTELLQEASEETPTASAGRGIKDAAPTKPRWCDMVDEENEEDWVWPTFDVESRRF
eukprot:TRINITY_DN122105_c0_g1_i1.p1 TRINITY_DN122105_c0_g1~~TRINITY_DN122105_c0_g1_i1.p1  ORF type:complete len:195 (+),score=42.86 TRINITY_DN122105_c0_g1_i1:162-746(+)